jgi:hypothetical protein
MNPLCCLSLQLVKVGSYLFPVELAIFVICLLPLVLAGYLLICLQHWLVKQIRVCWELDSGLSLA